MMTKLSSSKCLRLSLNSQEELAEQMNYVLILMKLHFYKLIWINHFNNLDKETFSLLAKLRGGLKRVESKQEDQEKKPDTLGDKEYPNKEIPLLINAWVTLPLAHFLSYYLY